MVDKNSVRIRKGGGHAIACHHHSTDFTRLKSVSLDPFPAEREEFDRFTLLRCHEAGAMGFDTEVLRAVISIRGQDQNERMEHEAVLDTLAQDEVDAP